MAFISREFPFTFHLFPLSSQRHFTHTVFLLRGINFHSLPYEYISSGFTSCRIYFPKNHIVLFPLNFLAVPFTSSQFQSSSIYSVNSLQPALNFQSVFLYEAHISSSFRFKGTYLQSFPFERHLFPGFWRSTAEGRKSQVRGGGLRATKQLWKHWTEAMDV